MTFALYPEARHFCSLADYGAILSVTQRLQPKRVLEFGPGWSTLALIEGGALLVDACEDQTAWLKLWQDRLQEHRAVVTIRAFDWVDPLTIDGIDDRYDMALIDGPYQVARRPAVISYALSRCDAVLVPLECAGGDETLRRFVIREAEARGPSIEIMETGPLAGSFALLTC